MLATPFIATASPFLARPDVTTSEPSFPRFATFAAKRSAQFPFLFDGMPGARPIQDLRDHKDANTRLIVTHFQKRDWKAYATRRVGSDSAIPVLAYAESPTT
jgi:hypothetical protein